MYRLITTKFRRTDFKICRGAAASLVRGQNVGLFYMIEENSMNLQPQYVHSQKVFIHYLLRMNVLLLPTEKVISLLSAKCIFEPPNMIQKNKKKNKQILNLSECHGGPEYLVR